MKLTMYAAATGLYKGPPPVPAFEYARFAEGNAGTVITGDGRILTFTGGGGIASCLMDAPVSGNTYIELLCTTNDGAYAGACGYGGTVRPLPDGQVLGAWWTEPGFDFTFSQWTMWWSVNYGMGANEANGSDSNTGVVPSTYRARMAVRAGTRRFWIQKDAAGWVGGGNPETDTTPSFILNGTADIYLGASLDPNTSGNQVELLTPDNYLYAPPAGFTAGIIVP